MCCWSGGLKIVGDSILLRNSALCFSWHPNRMYGVSSSLEFRNYTILAKNYSLDTVESLKQIQVCSSRLKLSLAKVK